MIPARARSENQSRGLGRNRLRSGPGDPLQTAVEAATRLLAVTALACLLLSCASESTTGSGHVLRVGPERSLRTPSEAARLARAGDIIEIDAGQYTNDFATWRQHNLTIRGVGGMAHLRADRMIPNGQAIWIIQGNDTVIENIEFSGARVPSTNGSGIRHQGGNLTLRNTYFHHNEFSILSGRNITAHIDVRDSRFWHQRRPVRWSHGIYIGEAGSLTLIGNHFLGTDTGHHIKSRARKNYILYNRIEDIAGGNASRSIDLSNCGLGYVVGNDLHQGNTARNLNIIGYGMEGCEGRSEREKQLLVAHNTLVNEAHTATLVWTRSGGHALVMNNLIYGPATILRGRGEESNNLSLPLAGSSQARWHLPAGSPAIDAATTLPAEHPRMVPKREFQPPIGSVTRRKAGPLDIGSREARELD